MAGDQHQIAARSAAAGAYFDAAQSEFLGATAGNSKQDAERARALCHERLDALLDARAAALTHMLRGGR